MYDRLKLRSRLCALFFALLLVLAAPFGQLSPAHAQEPCDTEPCAPAAAGQKGAIRIGYTQFAPFSRSDMTGIAVGYSIDLLRLLLEPRGYSLTFVPFDNPSDLLQALERGDVDATSLLGINAARREVGAFSDIIQPLSISVFVTHDGPRIDDVSDLSGLRIGSSDGSHPAHLVQQLENVTFVPVASTNGLLLPLLSNDVDGIAAPVEAVLHAAARAHLSDRIRQSIALQEVDGAILVDPDQPQVLADLNRAIASEQASGRIALLQERWFSASTPPLTSRERLVGFLAALCVIGVGAYWAKLHFGVLRTARISKARADRLHEALNETGATLLIADKDMRPVWWNDNYLRNFPKQLPLLNRHTRLPELIEASLMNGTQDHLPFEEAHAQASEIVEKLKIGAEIEANRFTTDGKILRSRTRMLPSGEYVVIAVDVTSFVRANEELKETAEKLAFANERLDKFSKIAAHDLKTPVRNIRELHKWIQADMADHDLELPAEVQESFDHATTLLNQQDRLISDLLDYSKSSHLTVPESFDPAERLEAIAQLSSIPKGFSIAWPTSMPRLCCNPTAFDIVLRNLLSNAVKHHDRATGTITVIAEAKEALCHISVRDDGPGIPEQYLKRIFEPFETLQSRSGGESSGGTGLGLSFIHDTVARWGGTVAAKSRDGARGTCFTFSVPLAQPLAGDPGVVALSA